MTLDLTLTHPEAERAGRPAALRVIDLSVSYRIGGGVRPAAVGVGFDLHPGRTTALLGESGSGKSTVVATIVGALAHNARVVAGRVELSGRDLLGLPARSRRRIRGTEVGYVPQNPGGSLDPLLRVGAQVAGRSAGGLRAERVVELLASVGFEDPEAVAAKYPHELSGGMQQRVLIAGALASDPSILIADEPTSALDVTVQRRILDLLEERRQALGTAMLLVTHDIKVAAERSDHVVVLRHGRVVEQGPTQQVLSDPQHDYTRSLLRDVPRNRPAGRPPLDGERPPAIEVRDLAVDYGNGHRRFRAVRQIGFGVPRGSTLAMVGESGSGKTTTARALARLHPWASGEVLIRARDNGLLSDLGDRGYRREVQYVYQNPRLSLDPRRTIAQTLAEPLRAYRIGDRRSRRRRVAELLEMVALPAEVAGQRPQQLSGGQQQRVAIARALALEPSIVILDEPVSALDVTVQAQILRLLERLQDELALTYVLISHDLAVVRQISDQVVVLHHGRIVEQGPVEQVFCAPAQDYTQRLLEAAPHWG